MNTEARRRLSRRRFESRLLGNSRDVWIQTSSQRHQGVLLFLDAEHYLDDIGAVQLVDELQRRETAFSLLPVYVSHIDYPTRWRESFCNPGFAAFLASELLPWIAAEFDVGDETPNAIVGVSLTGLAAAHAALLHPETLHRALCQSGSFWWEDGWLIDEVSRRPPSKLTLRLSVGLREVDENVDHRDGLFQRESQLSSNRRMRDALARKGIGHTYCELDGGHDLASFSRDLPAALAGLQNTDPLDR